MRRVLKGKYGLADLRADVLAGIVVGIVALPLSMALAIAVGVPPQHGLYTAIFAGALVALLGGSKFQVTGPTAAFVVILAPIVSAHGLTGLLTAGFMAGLMLVAMGIARMGRLIQYIPHPVTTGFTTGIATVIATLQIKDMAGLQVGPMPEHFTDKVAMLWAARGTVSLQELGVAVATLGLLLGIPRLTRRIPAPLLAIGAVSAVGALLHHFLPAFTVATIGTRFQTVVDGVTVAGIPPVLPVPAMPWGSTLDLRVLRELFPAAFAIAMLGAIESLLSAVDRRRHDGQAASDPDAELVGLGIGNLVAPIFGGIAATGALARTATNIRAGARSPVAAVTHAFVILVSIVALAPLVAYVPMASLAAMLILVAYNMSEVESFTRVVRVAPKSDVAILLACYGFTVIFDMVIAVTVGVLLAAVLFMRRMAEMTQSRTLLESISEDSDRRIPPGVALYEINGPLFFGAAQSAMGAMHTIRGDTFVVMVLDLGKVPVIDSTGLVALETAISKLCSNRKHVILAGPLPKPSRVWEKAKLEQRYAGLEVAPSLEEALRRAEVLAAQPPPAPRSQRGHAHA
jgi:SulP family sulfate permease